VLLLPMLTYDGSHPITIELMVRAAGDASGGMALLTCQDLPGPRSGMGLGRPHTGQWSTYAHDDPTEASVAGGRFAQSDQKASVGKWPHLAAVLDGPRLRLYVDGSLQRMTGTLRDPYVPSGLPWRIGMDSNGEQRWVGDIDEVRISDFARYQSDFIPAGRLEPDEHTVALYHCDDRRGETLTDCSGQGHHGTIHGDVEFVRVAREVAPAIGVDEETPAPSAMNDFEGRRFVGYPAGLESDRELLARERFLSASVAEVVPTWNVQSGGQLGMLELAQSARKIVALPDRRATRRSETLE